MAAPPFTLASAHKKVKTAQNLWNTCDPAKIALAYTPDSVWRNRDQFAKGRAEIEELLKRKWAKERNYTLRKELFAFDKNRIAVQFWYEYSLQADAKASTTEWFRCYGLEHWVFAEDGKMATRQMSGNDVSIKAEERWFKDDVDPDSITIPEGHWSLSSPLE